MPASPIPVEWASDDSKCSAVAHAAVAIAFQGMRPTSSPHSAHLRTLLTKHGLSIRNHPMWLHTSTSPPHDEVIRRLSNALDVSLPSVEYGYHCSDDFVDQLARFVAWYSIPRSSPAHSTVLARLAALASRLGPEAGAAGPKRGAAASSAGHRELDVQDDPGQGAAEGGGITDADSIRDALRTVQNPVVLEGLLNNQLAPAGIPKGMVRSCQIILWNSYDRGVVGPC